jgi:hypothetical protein
MNVYELDLRVRIQNISSVSSVAKVVWKGAETESFHDYVDVMISASSAGAAMTISFCCSYHPAHMVRLCVDDNIH